MKLIAPVSAGTGTRVSGACELGITLQCCILCTSVHGFSPLLLIN